MAAFHKFRALARNWEALGDSDPLFAVLSNPAKLGGRWDADEFFASGRAHVKTLFRMLDDARAGYERGTCLDFGCGVGRLTFPLAEVFARTVGVDVARPMIARARSHLRPGDRCEFVVNRAPDLRQFADGIFDVVHSCLVLQHIPPEVSVRYVGEFFRVCRPGGLVVFQLPAEARSNTVVPPPLPDAACAAHIEVRNPPASLGVSARHTLRVALTNRGPIPWLHDLPAGRHICLGNHWLREDGSTAIQDDARAFLPHAVDPGTTVEVALRVQAPPEPGAYVLELDLVQEHVCWFAEKGSLTARVPIHVTGATKRPGPPVALGTPVESRVLPPASVAPQSFLRRVLSRVSGGGTPTFEMHAVPVAEVERAIEAGGGYLLRAVDDNAAGPNWLSYTYICRTGPVASASTSASG